MPVGWLGAWGAVRWRPSVRLGPLRDPSGTLPGPPAACGPRGTLPAPRAAVLSALPKEICVSGARGSAFSGLRPWSAPRAMLLAGARPPLRSLVCRRAGSRPGGVGLALCALVLGWLLGVFCVRLVYG